MKHGMQRVESSKIDMFTIDNFLTPQECAHCIKQIIKGKTKSTTSDSSNVSKVSDFRTSSTAALSKSDPVIGHIERKICDALKLPMDLSEGIQGQMYEPQQYFKPHTDYFNEDGSDSYKHHTKDVGNRTWTFMVYLNAPLEGGETRFTRIGKSIKPKQGMAVFWNNRLHGNLNPDSEHEGVPIKSGFKCVLTKWFREKSRIPRNVCGQSFIKKQKIVLLHWYGRFGNRMFLYAFGCALAKYHNVTFYYPSKWEGDELFEPCGFAKAIPDVLRKYLTGTDENCRVSQLDNYKRITGDSIEFLDTRGDSILHCTNFAFSDLHCMYFDRLFKLVNTSLINQIFKWNSAVRATQLYRALQTQKRLYDAAHIRMGDIAQPTYNGAHSLISLDCYKNAIEEFTNKDQTYIVSDESLICNVPKSLQLHKSVGHRFQYPEGEIMQCSEVIFDFLPDLLVLTHARRIIRANSSFSFWAVALSGLSESNIWSPVIQKKPLELSTKFYEQKNTQFVNGYHCHFMGLFDDIRFGS